MVEPVTDQNLQGKTLILYPHFFVGSHRANRLDRDTMFAATGGFGCEPALRGQAIGGSFGDGEICKISRRDVQFIVVSDERNHVARGVCAGCGKPIYDGQHRVHDYNTGNTYHKECVPTKE